MIALKYDSFFVMNANISNKNKKIYQCICIKRKIDRDKQRNTNISEGVERHKTERIGKRKCYGNN